MTWHLDYIKSYLANPGQNDAAGEPYFISVLPATRVPGQPYWRCIGIHHLTGQENHGQHHVFCDVLDEQGQRIDKARINILTNGKPRGFMICDKPPNEPATNTQMHWEDTLTLFIAGDAPGDKPTGFHTRHPDTEPGNTRGHHSFYAVWQRVTGEEPEPPEPPTEPPAEDWREGLTPLEEMIADDPEAVASLIVKMRERLDG